MGKVQRLTHKQIEAAIKRDELREFLEGSGAWIKGHLENVLIGVVVAALLIFGAVYLLNSRSDDAIKASIQLASAEQQFARAQGGGEPQAYEAAKAAYEQVRAGFEGSPEAVAAELGLANLAFSQGKIDEAKAAFERLAAGHPNSAYGSLAASGAAQCLEAQGKLKEAAAAYSALAQSPDAGALAAASYFDAARVQQALGDKAGLAQSVKGLEQMDAQKRLPESLRTKFMALKKRA